MNHTYRQGLEEVEFSKDDWCNLLSISHRFECEGARKRSIKEINKIGSPLIHVDKIVMAKRFGVEEWLVPACVALVERADPLTHVEADKLGLEMTVSVSNAREKYIRAQRLPAGQVSTTSGGLFVMGTSSPVQPTQANATQLVKGILGIK